MRFPPRSFVTLPAALLLAASAAAAQPARRTAPPPVEVTEASVADLQDAMAAGRTTAVALVNAYLASVPDAPVRSVRDILDRGLADRRLEARFRIVDTVSAEDTPWHRTILARQGALRTRVDALMDSLRLDALAYPAMRQKPVALGEVQGGGTCNLSAQGRLPVRPPRAARYAPLYSPPFPTGSPSCRVDRPAPRARPQGPVPAARPHPRCPQ